MYTPGLGRLIPDMKTSRLTSRGFPLDLHVFNLGSRRAHPQAHQQVVDRATLAFCFDFHSSVSEVSHPSSHTTPLCDSLRKSSIAHSLDSTANDDTGSHRHADA